MAKMKLSEAIAGARALSQLSDSKRLKWDLQWEISDIIDALEKHIKRFNEEQKVILETYGEKIPGRDSYKVEDPNKREEYNEAIEALGETEVTVDFQPLLFIKLEDAELNVLGTEFRLLKKHFISREKVEKKDPNKVKEKEKEVKAKMGKVED